MKHLSIRFQRVWDAKRFYEILRHPDFVYFPAAPKSVEEEKEFLRQSRERRRRGMDYNFTILYRDRVVGAIGIKVDQHRRHIGEIGFFIDRTEWGKGFAPAAVRLAEPFAFEELGLRRIEIVMLKRNRASRRVAEKCGYRREGVQRAKVPFGGEYLDAYCYAKVR